MIATACDIFFNIPELVERITHFLPKHDLFHLLQTNRNINCICTPALWRQLDFTHNSRILDTPRSLYALRDNMHRVRSITWHERFSWWYIHALWAYLNSHTKFISEAHQSIPTDALSHPTWGRLNDPIKSPQMPIPPMLSLTHYKSSFGKVTPRPSFRPAYSFDAQRSHQHHLMWFLRLNRATLTTVELSAEIFLSDSLVRDICRTISQLEHLRILRLIFPDYLIFFTRDLVQLLFLSCPASLGEFTVSGMVLAMTEDIDVSPKRLDWDFDQGPLVLRQDPLHHLSTLELPSVDSSFNYNAAIFCSILRHCPALKDLTLRSIQHPLVIQAVSETIAYLCPPITNLTIPFVKGFNNEAFMNIMEGTQEQKLEMLTVSSLHDESSRVLSTAAISRHSETLCQIELASSWKAKSTTLQAILVYCRALVIFKIQKAHNNALGANLALSLEDAAEADWGCTRIRHLVLFVSLTSDGRDPAYLADPSMAIWTEQDHRHWRMLNKFYTQIGSLKELQFLNLMATGSNPVDGHGVITDVPYKYTCLPGLLALEDPATGQIGFLSRWSGLTRLQKLGGSFSVMTKETAARMGKREVDWFVNHLPALTSATFMFIPYSHAFTYSVYEVDSSIVGRYPQVICEFLRRRPSLNPVELVDDAR